MSAQTIAAILFTTFLMIPGEAKYIYRGNVRTRFYRQSLDYCVIQDVDNQRFFEAYPQCTSLINGAKPLHCDKTCGPLYKTFIISRCTVPEEQQLLDLVFDYYESECMFNEAGRPCYFYNYPTEDYSSRHIINITTVQLCNSTIEGSECTEACRDILSTNFFHSFHTSSGQDVVCQYRLFQVKEPLSFWPLSSPLLHLLQWLQWFSLNSVWLMISDL